jgi:hypothetical protein
MAGRRVSSLRTAGSIPTNAPGDYPGGTLAPSPGFPGVKNLLISPPQSAQVRPKVNKNKERDMKKIIASVVVLAASAGLSFGGVIMDDEGVGFVGKGDVQLVYGWSNKDLQDNAGLVQFRVALEVGDTTWKCLNSHNGNVQTRSNETTHLQVVNSTARVRTQVTGFNLNGLGEVLENSTTGDATGSCPSGQNWSLVAGSIKTNGEGTLGARLEVSGNGGATWDHLEIDPLQD